MGITAENLVAKWGITREEQDALAVESHRRAAAAIAEGRFKSQIVPIVKQTKKGEVRFDTDEHVKASTTMESLAKLKPAFKKDGGTVTAANSSKINDGAAALVVTSADYAEKHNLKPIARIIAQSSAAQEPEWFTTAPAKAIDIVLRRARMSVGDIDLFEVNEAFAAVAMAAMKDANIPHEKLNVNGGAVALGHPIGASGARILVTLIHAMHERGARRGLAAICIGGGEAAAMIVERV
jgi:acetyl-CoA C-acetyltransferase